MKLWIIPIFACLFIHASALGQGAAIFMPLSKTVFGTSKSIPFRISNRLDSQLTLIVEPECEVDGKTLVGAQCWNYFKLVVDSKVVSKRITIKDGETTDGVIHRKTSAKTYAFFKAKFRPQLNEPKQKKSGVSFVFDYQPGYLFLIDHKNAEWPQPNFEIVDTNDARIAKFKFPTTNMQHPELVSVSAKIVDKNTKKLMRFMRIANHKIVDPKRGNFELTGNFADPGDKTDVCYQIYLQRHAVKEQVSKYSNCK